MSTAGAVIQNDNTTYISSISSGLDTNSLVEAAVAQKTAPADRIDIKVEENDLKAEAYKELQKLSLELENSLNKLSSRNYSALGGSNDFDLKQAYLGSSDLSDPTSIIAVSADNTAIATNYNVEVTQLAQKMKVTSAAQNNAPLGLTGDFSLGLEGRTNNIISVTPEMTISDLADKINATSSETGVNATLISIDADTVKLVLSADQAAQQISFSIISGENVLSAIGVSDNLGNFATINKQAQPAIIIVDGNEVVRNSNEIDDVISGLSFSLLNAQPGSVINIDIEHDYNAVKTSLTDFIDSYNALREFILNQQNISEDGLVSAESILFADTLVRNMDAGIYDILNTTSFGSPLNIDNLAQMGIEMDTSNRLFLADENKLDTILLSDFSALENFFETTYTSSDSRLKILNNSTLNSGMNFSLSLSSDDQGNITAVQADGQSGLFDFQGNLITGKKGTQYDGLSFAITLDPLESKTIDVNIHSGFTDSLGNYLSVYSNDLDGLVQNEITTLSNNNSTLKAEAARIRFDAEIYRQKEIEKYAKMEIELQNAELLRKQIASILGDNGND
ncbi:MAG: flagellar hook protein [Alphaproteobacteria bacterium]|nr:MAG: flagellar hook protein [Alphaproteobacteria bacterium]